MRKKTELRGLPICFFLVILAVIGSACSQDRAAHNQVVLGKESSEQAKLKERLSHMTPAQMQAELTNNPRARALLMPRGMGNPADRFGR